MMYRKIRARLGVEALEDRWSPATLTITPRRLPWIEPDPQPVVQESTAQSGLATTSATLTITPRGRPWIDPEPQPIVQEVTAAAQPGLATAEAHTGGVVQWSPGQGGFP